MTGPLTSPSKNAYSRWGGSSFSSTSRFINGRFNGFSFTEFEFFPTQAAIIEVGSSSRARNESASSNKSKLTVPERARLEKHCGIMKFWSRLKCDGFLPHEGIEVTTGAITGATLAQDLELRD
ncbi:hypothetical protein Tco_0684390 [Tanacetum coccineum]